jgi:parallel beta-helix repeat protein
MRLARYPNNGWLRITSGSENTGGANTQIQCDSLVRNPRNAAGVWVGAQMRVRRWSWWYETRPVTAYTAAGNLTLGGTTDNGGMTIAAGWGFYMDNKLSELDTAGEWYYDSTAKKVYLWPPQGINPESLLVEGTVLTSGVSVNASIVRNLCFGQYQLTGLSVTGISAVTGCRFENIGGDKGGSALSASWNIQRADISHCVFQNNLNVAIAWNANPAILDSSYIEYDTLLETGTVPGYGGHGSWHAAGIIVSNAVNLHIRNNYFDGTGYAGIIFGHDGNFSERNIIKRAMSTLNDGGAIYCNCSYTTIRNNIILNTEGDLESSGPWSNLGHGIWPEFLSNFKNQVIENNTVAYSGGFGLFLPNNYSCTIRNNVFYGNERAQFEIEGSSTSGTGTNFNNYINGNVLFSTSAAQKTLLYRTGDNFGTISGNYYCDPYMDQHLGEWQNWNIVNRTPAVWSLSFVWADKSYKTDIIKRPASPAAGDMTGIPLLVINNTEVRKACALDSGVYLGLDGDTVKQSVTLDPYTSRVLVHTGKYSSISTEVQRKQAGSSVRVLGFSGSHPVFSYDTREKSDICIRLFTVQGREVRRIMFHASSPGRWNIMWNGLDAVDAKVSRGIYLFKFESLGTTARFSVKGKVVID